MFLLQLAIVILFIMALFIFGKYIKKEQFTLDSLNRTNNIFYKFCKKLNSYDSPSTLINVKKNIYNKKIKNNKKKIIELNRKISVLQKNIIFNDVPDIKSFNSKTNNIAKIQNDIIQKAKKNLNKRNDINVKLNYR